MKTTGKNQLFSYRMGAMLLLAATAPVASHAQNFKVLYTFTGGADGGYPQYGRLIADTAGNLYGTATFGGDLRCPDLTSWEPGCGVVFKLDPVTGQETVLHRFSGGVDGAQPWAGLIHDPRGNLYGTAAFGGTNGAGVIFKIDLSGHEHVLHAFNYTDGAIPTGELVEDLSGNLYGTTVTGGSLDRCAGAGCGVIFRQSASGELTVLHNFSSLSTQDGANPTHALTLDAAGNIYGTSENGGVPACLNYGDYEAVVTYIGGCGTIFKLNSMGETSLFRFGAGPDGSDPRTALTQDNDGNLYGTTFAGGLYGGGTVFKLDPTTGHETVLYNFQGLTDGANPWGGVAQDPAGNLYGIANHAGGSCYCGTVFKLDRQGNYTVLHTFTYADGAYPEAPLRIYNEALYGITSGGGTLSDGSSGTGTIFQITLPADASH